MRLSAEELKEALAKDYNVVLDANEVKVCSDYFHQKFKTRQIKKMDFIKLLRTEWDRKHDKAEARESLFAIKNKLP